MIYIYNGIVLSHSKECNNAMCSNVNGPGDYYTSKVSQTEEDKYHMLSLTVESLKMIKVNLFLKQNKIHRYRKQIHGYQRGKVGAGVTNTHYYV